jgi:hypothetical protein
MTFEVKLHPKARYRKLDVLELSWGGNGFVVRRPGHINAIALEDLTTQTVLVERRGSLYEIKNKT